MEGGARREGGSAKVAQGRICRVALAPVGPFDIRSRINRRECCVDTTKAAVLSGLGELELEALEGLGSLTAGFIESVAPFSCRFVVKRSLLEKVP